MKCLNSRSFLWTFFSIVIIGLISIISANIVVDPFYRFNLFTIRGVNLQRYQFSSNVRMGKAGSICRVNPDTIILGSSRAEIGLDPKHPGFKFGPVYSLAMAGTGLQEMRDTLRHTILAAPNLRRAVIAIDFFMFNAYREEALYRTEVFDFDPKRLLHKPGDTCVKNFYYDADKLIGFKGLRYVFETVHTQHDENEKEKELTPLQAFWWLALYDADGFRGKSYDGLEKKQGVIFSDNAYGQEQAYIKKIWRAGPHHRYCFVKSCQPNTLDTFRELINLAREAKLDVMFVINPVHVSMLLSLQEIGLWPLYEDWKRALVKVISEDAAEHHSSPYLLWDFSGFNSITMEDPPTVQGKKISKWFWESSHYKRITGDLILNKVFNVKQNTVPADFGIELNQTNIEAWIDKSLNMSRLYIASHKKEVENLRAQLSKLYDDDWEGANCGDDMQAVRKGSALLQQGNVKAANALFELAQKIHEADRQRAIKLNMPYRELAFEHFLSEAMSGKVIDEPLETWVAYQNRGILKAGKKDFQGAIVDYTKALRDSPPNPALYSLRGTTKLQLKDFKGAEQDFLAGLKLDPNNVDLKKLLLIATASKSQPSNG